MERLVSNLRQFEAGHGVNVSAIRAKTGKTFDLTELLDGDLGRTLAKVADDAARVPWLPVCAMKSVVRWPSC